MSESVLKIFALLKMSSTSAAKSATVAYLPPLSFVSTVPRSIGFLIIFGYVGSLSARQSTGARTGPAAGLRCIALSTPAHCLTRRSASPPGVSFCFLTALPDMVCAGRR